MSFRERLISLRKKSGWSQEELGHRLDVSRQTVSKWESGDTTPEMRKLVLMGELFDVSLDYLARGEEPFSSGSLRRKGRMGISGKRGRYEYKSPRTLWGLPLVHIVQGPGPCRARGILAVGKVSVGVLSVGFLSVGVVSLGFLTVGLLSLGLFAVGLMSAGTFALGGAVAVGALAWGDIAVGSVAKGDYALGAVALGGKIGIGDYARGYLAIGNRAQGAVALSGDGTVASLTRGKFLSLVHTHLPGASRIAVALFSRSFSP